MASWQLFFQRLICLMRKEFLVTLKDPRSRVILIVPAFLQSMVFGYGATYDLQYVPYVALDLSHSAEGRELLSRVEGGGIFHRIGNLQNADEIADFIDSGKAALAIVIPQDFSRMLSSGGAAQVQLIADGRNTVTAGAVTRYVSHVLSEYNAARNPQLYAVQLESIAWYHPNLETRWTFLPALAVLMSMVQVLMLGGMSVAREREQGTFDQLLVMPLSPLMILIGKAAPPIVAGFFQSTIVLLICRYWFDVPMAGSLFAIYLTLFIFLLSCTGIGLSISAISSSMQQVMVYCFVLLMPLALLSGLATPVSNMPEALQYATYLNPLRFAIEALRRIYLEGAGVFEIAWNYLPMLATAAITMPLAAYLFRNRLQ